MHRAGLIHSYNPRLEQSPCVPEKSATVVAIIVKSLYQFLLCAFPFALLSSLLLSLSFCLHLHHSYSFSLFLSLRCRNAASPYHSPLGSRGIFAQGKREVLERIWPLRCTGAVLSMTHEVIPPNSLGLFSVSIFQNNISLSSSSVSCL